MTEKGTQAPVGSMRSSGVGLGGPVLGDAHHGFDLAARGVVPGGKRPCAVINGRQIAFPKRTVIDLGNLMRSFI